MDTDTSKELSLDYRVKRAIRSTSAKELDVLSKDICPYIRKFVASNVNTRKATIKKLANDESISVRESALKNPKFAS